MPPTPEAVNVPVTVKLLMVDVPAGAEIEPAVTAPVTPRVPGIVTACVELIDNPVALLAPV